MSENGQGGGGGSTAAAHHQQKAGDHLKHTSEFTLHTLSLPLSSLAIADWQCVDYPSSLSPIE